MDLNEIITSQDFTSDEIVEAKRTAADYTIFVSPAFEIDGARYRVLLDGHHSLAAALADGVNPEIVEMTDSEHDAIQLLEDGQVDEFLQVVHQGSDYHYAVSGQYVW